MMPDSVRRWGPPDSEMHLPITLKRAISTRNDTSVVKMLSNVGVSSIWISMTIFAIAKSYVKTISRFPHSTANCSALFITSWTTAVNVDDWLMAGKYHIVAFLSIRCCAFQPIHICVDYGRMLNWIIHNKLLTFASWQLSGIRSRSVHPSGINLTLEIFGLLW